MKLSEDKLVGWLCIIRLSFAEGRTLCVPHEVQRQLVERGWLEISPVSDWRGKYTSHVTDDGAFQSDLVSPEWGIDPVGVA